MEYTFENLNTSSIILSRELLNQGIKRKTRGFNCIEFPEPVLIKITNPSDRYINIKLRKNNKYLPFAESLALAAGVNNMNLYAKYVPSMMEYSDDGKYQRAGYGSRIRSFTGFNGDYKIDDPKFRNVYSGSVTVVDQLKFVIETLKKDINSRQAIITIADPGKDCFGEDGKLKVTKDMPCSRSIQFMIVDNKLDATLYIRSNDFIFGYQAVNVFNFTWMQEYVANILEMDIGNYYHFANNFHFYEDKLELVKAMADLEVSDYESEFGIWQYKSLFRGLEEFDNEINDLFYLEKLLPNEYLGYTSKFDMFTDWGRALIQFRNKEKQEFINPYLKKLFK